MEDKTIQAFLGSLPALEGGFDVTLRSAKPTPTLPPLSIETTQEDPADLEMLSLLGEGGMGQVFLANQRSLARQVAVKTLQEQYATPKGIQDLLQESQRTGALEHPNIVPVYVLTRNARGLPLLVMKRVNGVSWRDLIQDQDHPLWQSFSGDRLLTHLELLQQICNAVHFAHSKGILHRDIKPANVMIGQFGEVYLLDWGVALSLKEARTVNESNVFSGTLAYMAPEMVQGPTALTPKTDVYLLGATLHEVLTGQPPHQGDTALAVVYSALNPQHQYDPSLPYGVIEICKKAMSPDPKDRYQNAQEMRQAISRFIQNRGALALAEASKEKLMALKALLKEPKQAASKPNARKVYELFSECRFGFEQALKSWPEYKEAKALRDEALITMLEYELSQENTAAAEGLLASLTMPDLSLKKRFEEIKKNHDEKEDALKQLKEINYQKDTNVSGWQRNVVVASTFFCYLAVALFLWWREQRTPETAETLLWMQLFFVGASLVVALPTRKVFFRNEANRLLYYIALFLVAELTLVHLIGYVLKTPSKHLFIFDMIVWSFFSGALSLFINRVLSWSVVAHAAAALLASFFPAYASFLLGGAMAVTGGCMFALWRDSRLWKPLG